MKIEIQIFKLANARSIEDITVQGTAQKFFPIKNVLLFIIANTKVEFINNIHEFRWQDYNNYERT